jgi:hypothetical protein
MRDRDGRELMLVSRTERIGRLFCLLAGSIRCGELPELCGLSWQSLGCGASGRVTALSRATVMGPRRGVHCKGVGPPG